MYGVTNGLWYTSSGSDRLQSMQCKDALYSESGRRVKLIMPWSGSTIIDCPVSSVQTLTRTQNIQYSQAWGTPASLASR